MVKLTMLLSTTDEERRGREGGGHSVYYRTLKDYPQVTSEPQPGEFGSGPTVEPETFQIR
jgi:hypothetical protein